jgi:hypothetical protein
MTTPPAAIRRLNPPFRVNRRAFDGAKPIINRQEETSWRNLNCG